MDLNTSLKSLLNSFNMSPEALADIRDSNNLLEDSNIAPGLGIGKQGPDFALKDTSGNLIHLGDYLEKGPVVLSFFRGDWCPFCNLELKALNEIFDRIVGIGGSLFAISPQSPATNLNLSVKHDIKFEILSDPDNTAIEDYKLLYEVPEKLMNILFNTTGSDSIIKSEIDNKNRLPVPATYILDCDGTIISRYVSHHYDTRMEPEKILSTLENLVAIQTAKYSEAQSKNNLLEKNILQELEDMRDRLSRQDRRAMVGDLAGGLFHELKNLLNPISSLSLFSDEISEENQKWVQIIYDSRDRAVALIDEVKKLARNEEVHYSLSVYKISEIIDDAVFLSLMDSDVKGKEINIESNYNGTIVTDRNKLIQVLLNLLRNAAHAIENVDDGRINISIDKRGDQLGIEISDNGLGIEENKLNRIWEPFFTTKGEKGTGIGLDICKSIVSNLGGRISVKSKIGEGARFYINLPLELPK